MSGRLIYRMALCFLLASGMSGCGVYRDAAVQGASDVGTVAGVAIGVPLGIAAVTIGESFKTAGAVHKQPRLYERYPANQNQPALSASPVNYVIRNNQYQPKRYSTPQYHQVSQNNSPQLHYVNYSPPVRGTSYVVQSPVAIERSNSAENNFWVTTAELQ